MLVEIRVVSCIRRCFETQSRCILLSVYQIYSNEAETWEYIQLNRQCQENLELEGNNEGKGIILE